MSSKKEGRRRRQAQREEGRRKKSNPVTFFLLLILTALLLMFGAAFFLGERVGALEVSASSQRIVEVAPAAGDPVSGRHALRVEPGAVWVHPPPEEGRVAGEAVRLLMAGGA